MIGNVNNKSIANIFCYGAFADKNSGIVYHNLTGLLPFMSYDGNVCCFILYHYKSNSILETLIAGLIDISIFKAYKKESEMLVLKGFKPILNIMNNQATKHIKTFLTENDCKLQLVELHNHCTNMAECTIQTFKDAFVAALAITDINFPLQLWDYLMPQIQYTLNLMQASHIDPTKLAYEILNEPYKWSRYSLAPLGCKANAYKDGDTRGSWELQGVNAWYLGPSRDHYRCDYYYIIVTRAYHILGLTALFPQRCQHPNMLPHQHLGALTDELAEATDLARNTPKGKQLLKYLTQKIDDLLHPTTPSKEQRVANKTRLATREEEQRVIDASPIITILQISNLPTIMKTNNPTAKQVLKGIKCFHRPVTRHNTLGIMPVPVSTQERAQSSPRNLWRSAQTTKLS